LQVSAHALSVGDDDDESYTYADDDNNDVTDYSPEQFMSADGDDDDEDA